ncbi:MAG: hypothetical protein LBK95_18350, partial [Bifidobacteriaceae bacterium]|nr:hypothetical protein [Bifidobacteriaceae bacterium]
MPFLDGGAGDGVGVELPEPVRQDGLFAGFAGALPVGREEVAVGVEGGLGDLALALLEPGFDEVLDQDF